MANATAQAVTRALHRLFMFPSPEDVCGRDVMHALVSRVRL
jgi:hypothetical protein